MEWESDSQAGTSHWIDQAILDVDHLRQEISSVVEADRGHGGSETLSPETHERLHAVRQTLGELTHALATHLFPASRCPWVPPMEVCDKGREIEASFDLPGVSRASIRIRAADHTLFVSGERPRGFDSPDSIHFSERMHGPFERAVRLPCQVDAKASSALYRDGCLTVRLPKQTDTVPNAS